MLGRAQQLVRGLERSAGMVMRAGAIQGALPAVQPVLWRQLHGRALPASFENIIVEKFDKVALITLNRPKALNALNSALMYACIATHDLSQFCCTACGAPGALPMVISGVVAFSQRRPFACYGGAGCRSQNLGVGAYGLGEGFCSGCGHQRNGAEELHGAFVFCVWPSI